MNYYIYGQKVWILGSRKIYIQNDGVAMGLTLGLVLAYVFTVDSTALTYDLSSKLYLLMIASVLWINTPSNLLKMLWAIFKKVTSEKKIKKNGTIPFLHTMLARSNLYIVTTVHIKKTNTNIFFWIGAFFKPNDGNGVHSEQFLLGHYRYFTFVI